MNSLRLATGTVAATCVAIATLSVPSGASATAETAAEQRASGFALVAFKPPKAKTLRIPRSGRCILPKFNWEILTNYDDSMFSGRATVKSGRKTFGTTSNQRFSVNQQQYLEVNKPVCKPGTYTVTVKGKVTSTYPIDGYFYKTYERVSASAMYRVTKAH